MYIIFGNYGNQTIAVCQWIYEQKLENVHVVNVDTGWAAEEWQVRVNQGQAFAKKLGFNIITLKSKPDFQGLMQDRQEFPNQKFQWCAGFLKGLPFIDWLDEVDPQCEATIILGKRRADSRANYNLPEYIEESEHYNDRRVWHPLFQHTNNEFNALVRKTGFTLLSHRSLECDPCVNSTAADFARISNATLVKTQRLEQQINKTMFEFPIEEMVKAVKNKDKIIESQAKDMFNMGCGSPYACGE